MEAPCLIIIHRQGPWRGYGRRITAFPPDARPDAEAIVRVLDKTEPEMSPHRVVPARLAWES